MMGNKRDHSRKKIDITPDQLKRIKYLSVSGRRLESELGLSAEKINKTRQDLGLSFRRGNFKKEMKSGTTNKKIPKKIASKVESIFDAEKRIVDEGKKMRNSNSELESRRKQEGWRYFTRKGKVGISETVLMSPEAIEEYKKLNL